jgi:predicted peptidase
MTAISTALIWGTLFMASANDAPKIEPGKQLHESLTLHVKDNDKDSERDVTVRYLLFVPKDYQPTGQKWPLMLFMHGYGECGTDDLDLVKKHGPAKVVESRPDFPFIVISPQCPPPLAADPNSATAKRDKDSFNLIEHAWKPEEMIQLIDHTIKELNVDPDRVYVTGLSMGGYGTWRLAATYPDRFAAAVPICGGGEPEKMATALSKVPIWAFHGEKDPTVPVAESQAMVDAVKQAGGDARLTIYPGVQHNSWTQTYDNPELYTWLLSHHLTPKK